MDQVREAGHDCRVRGAFPVCGVFHESLQPGGHLGGGQLLHMGAAKGGKTFICETKFFYQMCTVIFLKQSNNDKLVSFFCYKVQKNDILCEFISSMSIKNSNQIIAKIKF